MRLSWKIAAAWLAMVAAPTAHAIDCSRATTPVERTICGNAELKAYDSYLGDGYARLRRGFAPDAFAAVQRAQRQWLVERDRACGTDVACLIRETQVRTATLVQMARDASGELPAAAPVAAPRTAPDTQAAAAALAVVPQAAGQSLGSRELFRHAARSLVVVLVFDEKDKAVSQGSGVVLANDVVATNCHVVSEGVKAVALYGGEVYPASRVFGNQNLDYCVMLTGGLPAQPAQVAGLDTIEVGQRVYSVGSPRGLELTIAEGLVSGLRPEPGMPLPLIQTSAPLSPGSSGGGLFDEYGRVIGITTMGLTDSQNLNFALPVELIGALDP